MRLSKLLAILTLAAAAQPASALETSLQYVLTLPQGANVQHAAYQCDEMDALLMVEYINASPNELAILPVEGDKLIFAAVLSASGVRFAAAQYEWWINGPEGNLYNRRSETDSPPVLHCLEYNETP